MSVQDHQASSAPGVSATAHSAAPARTRHSASLLPNLRSLSLLLSIISGVMLGIVGSVQADKNADNAVPLDEIRIFAEVLERIRSAYVEPTTDEKLLQSAIRGMLESLDPHSAYLEGDEYDDLQETTTGSFGGVGIEVGIEDKQITVIAPIDDTPAARAGIRTGDIITHLDGENLEETSIADAIDRMRGEIGSEINMTVSRNGKSLDFTLTRAAITISSVKQELLEPGFGYVRISQFQTSTGDDLRKALQDIESTNGQPLNGLILDLRNNPGGVLQASVAVSDAFLTTGRIVYTEGRLHAAQVNYDASGEDMLNDAPVVVLVNGGTASASEIVAGALQDHGRAVIMGTETFGKGSVQTVLPLNGNRAIKLTTARYFTPNGRSIQAQGITPDIEVTTLTRPGSKKRKKGRREADLPGHLSGTPEQKSTKDSDDKTGASELSPDTPPDNIAKRYETDDYQLSEALNLLRGVTILSMRKEVIPAAGNESRKSVNPKR